MNGTLAFSIIRHVDGFEGHCFLGACISVGVWPDVVFFVFKKNKIPGNVFFYQNKSEYIMLRVKVKIVIENKKYFDPLR